MSGFELLLEYLTRYFPILLFIFVALAFDALPGSVLHLRDALRYFRY